MEYLILTLFLCLGVILILAVKIGEQKKQEAWMANKIRESFGTMNEKEEQQDRKNAVRGYFSRHQDTFYIDDITWNDLEMDRIFSKMDITQSSAGQEYLYYLLRTPSFSQEELALREKLVCFWQREENIRTKVQMLFWKLGRTRKYSVYDYLEFLDTLGMRSNKKHYLCWLMLAAALGSFFIKAQLGLMALFCVIVWNIYVYLKEKRIIEPYLVCFGYVFKAINTAQKLTELSEIRKEALFTDDTEKLKSLISRFGGLKKSGHFGMHAMGDGSNPMQIMADYVNMMLHLDLIGFNTMLKQLRSHTDDIDALFSILGKMEALIAAASFRAALPEWCVPRLYEGNESCVSLELEQLYHPLICNPVKNDIRTKNGVLVTGSNASGKSTFLKAAAINAIFAQTIHTCAAASYCSCFFRVLSSMALRDDLKSSESYYIVEIKSLKRILDCIRTEGAPVLCFVDEVLRGTNTVERIAASTQILKSLHGEGVLCFAATHDIELTELLEQEYDNYHFQEQVNNGDIYFPYELMPGRAQTRNAIRLLSIMGYDENITLKADRLAAHFLEKGSWL